MNKILTSNQFYLFLKRVCSEIPETHQSEEYNVTFASFEHYLAAKANRTAPKNRDHDNLGGFAICMEPVSGRLSAKSDSNYDVKNVGFVVMKHCDRNQYENQLVIADQCLELGMKIIERFNMYRHKWDFLQKFDMNSVRYIEVEYMADNSCGYRFTFEIASPRVIKNELT